MAELSLKERLQPALFDRLIDDDRYVTTFQISTRTAKLQELKSQFGLDDEDLNLDLGPIGRLI